jgi:trehalose 6-phosphate synthase/phosphatase
MSKLLTISNRLPVTVVKKDGELKFQPSVGGLATGLASFYASQPSAWIGWPGITAPKINATDRQSIIQRLAEANCHPIFLSDYEIENFYHGFSNKTIWPLFHYFPLYSVRRTAYWAAYERVNEKFCNLTVEIAKPGDVIWIHDYHLMLLPQMIRRRLPDASIGFFLHIPFPAFDVFRLLPWRKELLEGLLSADLVGFHTYGYVSHFLNSVRRLLGYENRWGQINVGNRVAKADIFPMGIDYEHFANAATSPEVQREASRIRKRVGDRKIILSVDRLDYTKGIVERLEAYELFLARNPKYRGKVTLVMVTVPSRTAVGTYAVLKQHVDELVGRIVGKYGAVGWNPVWYLYRSLPFQSLVSYYVAADVALVTPLRDGMNLVAKEYVATRAEGTGVLILSEMAGAVEEMGEAIVVNPYDRDNVAEAIRNALEMPQKMQVEQNRLMQKRLRHYNVTAWARSFVKELEEVKCVQRDLSTRSIAGNIEKQLLARYRRAQHRLLLLDYDGTMVPFADRPEYAQPDGELLDILRRLAGKRKTEVVVISGRDREVLDSWLGELDINLIAEHGAWIKRRRGKWEASVLRAEDWKRDMLPILERYVDRTPGSFIEEKDYSLVMHFRKVDPELAAIRMGEIKGDLHYLTANLNLDILEGNKVIEVRDATINKGSAALQFVNQIKPDFLLALGDDQTDEDVFKVLDDSAYTIKVGISPSQAKYNLPAVGAVRSLLKRLAGYGNA